MPEPPLLIVHQGERGPLVSFRTEDINRASTARRIATEIEDLLADARLGPDQNLEVDLRGTTWLSTTALNQLIWVQRKARRREVSLVLLNVQSRVRNVFAMTRLERLFSFGQSRENAVPAEFDAAEA